MCRNETSLIKHLNFPLTLFVEEGEKFRCTDTLSYSCWGLVKVILIIYFENKLIWKKQPHHKVSVNPENWLVYILYYAVWIWIPDIISKIFLTMFFLELTLILFWHFDTILTDKDTILVLLVQNDYQLGFSICDRQSRTLES